VEASPRDAAIEAMVQEANDGARVMGETILHIPGEGA
jgi:hypothetical protein